MSELHIGSQAYFRITNPAAFDIDLGGFESQAAQHSFVGDPVEYVFSLPVTVLAAGASVYIVESGGVGDDILGPAIELFASDTTRVLLCAGACDVAAGSNVVDAARFGDGEEPLPFPPGIAFAGNLQNAMEGGDVFSYVRGSFLGAHPNFTANTWRQSAALGAMGPNRQRVTRNTGTPYDLASGLTPIPCAPTR